MEFDPYERLYIDEWTLNHESFEESRWLAELIQQGHIYTWWRISHNSDLTIIPYGCAFLERTKTVRYFK